MSERIALFRNEPEDVYISRHRNATASESLPPLNRQTRRTKGPRSMARAFDELVHIDTGTAIPGVRDHVERCADWLGKPLRVYETPPEVYDEIVVRMKGFPGPAQHNRCYNQLKERRLRDLVRELKAGDHKARVLALSGIRRSESSRRAKRQEITRSGALVFCNPLIDWTVFDLRRVMAENPGAPVSDVAAVLCRSGECQCGSMAPPGEREELRSLFPSWFAERIEPLEAMCRERGYEPATWGPGRVGDVPSQAGEMCSDCQIRFDDLEEAA